LFKNSKKFIIIYLIIFGAALVLSGYLTGYISLDKVTEPVKIIANTKSGCIAETTDRFSADIGSCYAKEGEIIDTKVETKLTEQELWIPLQLV